MHYHELMGDTLTEVSHSTKMSKCQNLLQGLGGQGPRV